jgi:tyrosinase
MRASVILAMAPAAIATAIPAFEESSFGHSFDKRDDITATTLGGKILSADLYAGVAGLNQQIYQATQKGDQWKKCNPLNIVVRREWYVPSVYTLGNYAYSIIGLRFLPRRKQTIFLPSNASQSSQERLLSLSAQAARIVTTISSQLTSSRPFQ